MDKTRTIGQKWLANELDLHFLALKKFTKFQSNRSIVIKLSNVKFFVKNQTTNHIDKMLRVFKLLGIAIGK